MAMRQPTRMAWIDLETTGLYPEADPILEIGMVVTTVKAPYEELARYESVCVPEGSTWHSRMHSKVVTMHTRSGLLMDLNGSTKTIRQMENEAIATLEAHGKPGSFLIAGSAVAHFDRKFIEAQMPALAEWFHYSSLDVQILRRCFQFAGRKDLVAFGDTFKTKNDKPHRGIDDVLDHLNEWRQYSELFAAIGVENEEEPPQSSLF